ncbi:MAG: hypothetical protein GY866_10535, partial [Proteobacteria bacterium]|nr:hypothetical protein [Pseudomonadota bacterium]
AMEHLLETTRDMRPLHFIFEDLICGTGYHYLKTMIYGSSDSLPAVMTKALIDVFQSLPNYDEPHYLLDGMSLVGEDRFISRKYGDFFGQCLKKTGCSKKQLRQVVELVQKQGPKRRPVPDFEDRVLLLLKLRQNGVGPGQLEQIAAVFTSELDQISGTLYRELLFHYDREYSNETLGLWNSLRETGNDALYRPLDLDGFCALIACLIKQDQDRVFLRFAATLKQKRAHTRTNGFNLGMHLLEFTQSLDALGSYVELLEHKTISIDQFISASFDEGEQGKRLEMAATVCISKCLSRLLEENGYHLDLYLNPMRLAVEFCDTPEMRGELIRNLKKSLEWGIDLDEWLNRLLSNRQTREEFIRISHPRLSIQLDFDEALPFLSQYTMALFGNVPLSVSPEGTPHTDGRVVFLPAYENSFPDSKKDLYNNRNASMYVANVFHEIGFHILAGSFLVDAKPTIDPFPNRSLAHTILNIMEDFRGREHFLSQPYNSNWKQILKQDERLMIKAMETPDNWKDHFMQVLVSKGCCRITPGDCDRSQKRREIELLKKPQCLFIPPDGQEKTTTLGHVLEHIVKRIESLKGKTVAHSLLLINPIYQIVTQIVGEGFQTKPDSCCFSKDMDLQGGQDAFGLPAGIQSGNREEQLRELGQRIIPHQGARDVPQKVEEEKGRLRNQGEQEQAVVDIVQDFNENQGNAGPPVNEKIWVGQYDHITGRELQSPFPIVPKTETRSHPQYELLYDKYNPVFKAMEEAVEDLKNEQAIIESEGRDPDEILIENLIEGIADPRSI